MFLSCSKQKSEYLNVLTCLSTMYLPVITLAKFRYNFSKQMIQLLITKKTKTTIPPPKKKKKKKKTKTNNKQKTKAR